MISEKFEEIDPRDSKYLTRDTVDKINWRNVYWRDVK